VNNQGEQIENHYPTKILGFLSIEGKREAVIQCSVKPLLWSAVERTFFVKIKLGTYFNISFVTVPIEALVYPLCVIPDSGGDSDIYFVVLPTELEPIFGGMNYHHYHYLSTVYVCERTEILRDVNNVQLQVMEYLDNCQETKYTGVLD
jgi:hypothetical protein